MNKDEKEARKMYEESAQFYHDYRTKINPKGWFFNEYLEMPSTLKILGNVKGKKVLDYGCGSGIYTKILVNGGANVKGFDISKEMLKIAIKENPDVELKIGSGYKIPFNEKFDIVLASLVVHYMKDWDKMFREVRRVLNNGGVFIFSSDNPVFQASKSVKVGSKKLKALGMMDYFKNDRKEVSWINPYNNKEIIVPYYHRTYETIIKTIIRNKFEIIDYLDCFPDKKSKRIFSKEYTLYSKVPKFMVFKVRKK